MTSVDRGRAKEIFLDAIELSTADRGALLAALQRENPTLYQRVVCLLEAHAEAENTSLDSGQPNLRDLMPSGPDQPGEVLGDYELLVEISAGASGVVWKAKQRSLGRIVAVKVLRAGRFASPQEVERFQAEAEAVARLEHPRIVPVYEVGTHEGRPYFSMRLLEGGSLDGRIGDFRPEEAARIVIDVAKAVHYAHQRGLLHRDLKPHNVLLDAAGESYVADFGIAKRIDGDVHVTGTLGVVGTPAYMAPEQTEMGGELTVATDVWALGCILYELLSGRPPFKGADLQELLQEIRSGDPFPLRALAPDAPRDLETIALACLRKDPARRYPSADAVAEDLHRWLTHEPIRARRTPAIERLYLYWRRSPLVASLLGLVGLLVLALGIGAGWANVQLEGHLRGAYVDQARAIRRSDEPGRRSRALEILSKAAAILPGPDVRDEAVACLALTDLAPLVRHGRELDAFAYDSELEVGLFFDEAHPYELRLVRLQDEEELRVLRTSGIVRVAEFSPAGDLILIKCHSVTNQQEDASFAVLDVETGEELWSRPEAVSYQSMAFDPVGERVVVGSFEGDVSVLEARTGRELSHFTVAARTGALAFRPDGEALAIAVGGGVNRLEVRALPTGELLASTDLPDSTYHIAWLSDGRIGAACADFNAYLLDLEGETQPVVLEGHSAEVVRLFASPTAGLVATNSWDGALRLWDSVTGSQVFSAVAKGRGFSKDGKRLGWTDRDYFGVWAVESGEVMRVLHGHGGKDPAGVRFSRDGRHLISVGNDGAVLWDAVKGTRVRRITDANVARAFFPQDEERFLLSGREGLVAHRFDDPTFREVVLEGAFVDTDVVEGGDLVALRRNAEEATLVDLGGNVPNRHLSRPAGLNSISLSPDGAWLAGGTWKGRGMSLWNTETGELERELLPDVSGVWVRFSPRGDLLMAGTSKDYIFYEVGSWREVRRFERIRSASSAGGQGAFSADGSMVALCERPYAISLFDLASGERLATLEAPHRSRFGRFEFSPDGKYLAIACADNRIQLWDLEVLWSELERVGL